MGFKKWLIKEWDYESKYGCESRTPGGNWGLCGASGILVVAQDTGRIMLDRRSGFVDGGDAWGIFGGAIDDINTDPGESAKGELEQETGYNGPIQLKAAYRYEDPNDIMSNGEPWFYQNYIGIVPRQIKTQAQSQAQWETEGGHWFDAEQVLSGNLQNLRMHPGLKLLLKHSGSQIKAICDKFSKR